MKKFFTLFVAALLSGNVFAQSQWTDYVVNGDFEGDDTSCFWSHDWADDNINQGPIRVVEDPTQPGNHVAIVSTRDLFEDEGSLDSWTFQFFVTLPNVVIEEGDELRLTMRIRADKAADSETQAHNTPGDYNYWNMYGNIGFTTEWQTVVKEALIGANQAHSEGGGKEMHTVAFNLYVLKEANNYYFDDVKLEIRKAEAPHELTGWLEMVRNGIDSNDMTQFANGTFTTFTGRDGVPGIDQPARIVNDPLDGQPALEVKSVAASYLKENLDEEGNVQSTTPMYIVREGNQNADHQVGDSIELTNWQSQFFVAHKHVFHTGQKVKFAIDARADHPTDIETQIHRGPGDYLHWDLFGNLSLTEEWQHFEFEQDITADQNGGSTVAFNLNVYKDADNTYYFKNIEFSCNEADASEEERTIASEDVVLPVAPSKEEADATHTSVSLKGAKDALLLDDVIGLISDDNMKLQTADGTLSEEFYTPEVGFYLNQDGSANGEEGDFIIEVAEDEENDDAAIFTVYNTKGRKLSDQVKSRFAFVENGWFYLVNLTLCNADEYTGINNAQTTVKNGAVYDLSGRKVVNPVKGIYIQNGKKFVVK